MTELGPHCEAVLLDDPRVGSIIADELRGRFPDLPEAIIAPLLEMQASAKRQSLVAQHPDAVVELLVVGESPVAYLMTDTADEVIRLCDIAVAVDARGVGHGRALLAALLRRADHEGEAVELSVWHDTPARSWYERHGFRTVGGDRDGYLEMRREPVMDAGEYPGIHSVE